MRLLAATLCDFAEIREGLLTIVSAGITRLWRDEFPASMGTFLALQVEVEPAERPFPHELTVVITGPSGSEVAKVTGGMQLAPTPPGTFDADEGALFSLPLDLRAIGVTELGWHNIAIAVDGSPLQTLRVKVARKPPPAGPSAQPVNPPGGRSKQPH